MRKKKEEISIKEFLKQLAEEIEAGLEGRKTDGINVELSVVKKVSGGGKLRFYVLSGGGDYQKEDVVKVSFKYYPKTEQLTANSKKI